MSKESTKFLIEPPKNIIIDTAPLLLFLIGMYDKNLISKFKRTEKYDVNSFEILMQFLSYSKEITITPAVLSEVSDLAESLKGERFPKFLQANMNILKNMQEAYTHKNKILDTNEVFKFGFADTSIILAAKEKKAGILTEDPSLSSYCRSIGINSIDFTTMILPIKDYFKT